VLDMGFVILDFAQQAYMHRETFPLILQIATGPLFLIFGVQLILGGLIPLVLIVIPKIRSSPIAAVPISLLVLAGVYAYRWNTVIGGQLLPKLETTILTYSPTSSEIMLSAASLIIAFAILAGIALLVPWRQVGDFYRRGLQLGLNPSGTRKNQD